MLIFCLLNFHKGYSISKENPRPSEGVFSFENSETIRFYNLRITYRYLIF
jgi:hypothetical protein